MNVVFRAVAYCVAIGVLAVAMINASVPDPAADVAQAMDALARASFDWNHHVEVLSGENTAAGVNNDGIGDAFYSDVSHVGPVWLLRQRAASRTEWKKYGMVVVNRRVYFASLSNRPTLLGAECAECHANGPRAIRGELRAGTETDRIAMNDLITNVRMLRLYYPLSEPEPKSHPLDVAPCTNCHNGEHRARLTDFNHRAIAYQLAHADTPPHSVFTPEERLQVSKWLNRY